MSESTPRVPLLKPWLSQREAFRSAVDDIFESRMLSNFAKYCRLLEHTAAGALENPRTLAVASCDIGLILAWRAQGLRSGEVITPSFTFASTVNALMWNGLTPVFADIDPRTFCVDVEHTRSLITPRTVGITAVHTFGAPADIDRLTRLTDEHNLALVFDAAHALGAEHAGRSVGAHGDVSVFSLSGTKLVTAGEGGLATFRRAETAERFRLLRGYGFIGDYNCRDVGLNGKISEMNAALGWTNFGRLQEALDRRREIVARYRDRLAGLSSLSFQAAGTADRHSYAYFAVLFEDRAQRERIEAALSTAGVQTKRYFLPVHRMAAYAAVHTSALPITDDAYARILCLPLFHELADSDIEDICDLIRNELSRATRQRG